MISIIKNIIKNLKNGRTNTFLEHRNETRGDGGIFFDYLNNGNWKNDFNFVKDIGRTFLKSYSNIVRKNLDTLE